jgi:hypothetical protein
MADSKDATKGVNTTVSSSHPLSRIVSLEDVHTKYAEKIKEGFHFVLHSAGVEWNEESNVCILKTTDQETLKGEEGHYSHMRDAEGINIHKIVRENSPIHGVRGRKIMWTEDSSKIFDLVKGIEHIPEWDLLYK